ncbi:MAG: hypothetical protein ACKV0T_18775 [Planctomycetales bacterium]
MSDSQEHRAGGKSTAVVLWTIGSLFLAYFGPFALIFVDELVLKTRYVDGFVRGISPTAHENVGVVLRTIYAPLLWIMTRMGVTP